MSAAERRKREMVEDQALSDALYAEGQRMSGAEELALALTQLETVRRELSSIPLSTLAVHNAVYRAQQAASFAALGIMEVQRMIQRGSER